MKPKKIQLDGNWIEAEYIGKGLFSKAYRHGDRVILLTKNDYSKEAVSLFADTTLKHLPAIERHENFGVFQVFSMPFYRPLTKRDYPEAYEQWMELRNTPTPTIGLHNAYGWIEKNEGGMRESLQTALRELVYAYSNYDVEDHLLLEFNKSNVSVNDVGDLVLRDCLASMRSIREARASRKRKYATFI